MSLFNNDRMQELFLVVGDKMLPVGKKWWYALGITVVVIIPFYYLVKFGFTQLLASTYQPPKIVYSEVAKEPLQILGSGIFSFPNNTYAGYVKVKNLNLGWGVASQEYTANFKTYGGTILTTVNGSTFILPASEKLIVFSRFTSQTKPDLIDFSLAPTNFIRKPDVSVNFELERISVQTQNNQTVVAAGIKNLTPFTVNQINLPVVVYDNKNEIIGTNFTYINTVVSGETRTFQYVWPLVLPGAVRAEISPEINIFDRNIFSSPPGVQPFSVSP